MFSTCARLNNRFSQLSNPVFTPYLIERRSVLSVAVGMTKGKIEFTSHTANLALMRNFVRKFLARHPFSEKERTLMVLGVDEACTNVIRYAYDLRDDQPMALSIEALSNCIRLRLRDYGTKTAPHTMRGRDHFEVKPGGLGLHLIRNAFDKVDYILKARGTELVLTKNLD
jgi:anti-sigma regulatory factor (Ser/Thr protein kinase)